MRKTETNPNEYEIDKLITLIWATIVLSSLTFLTLIIKTILWLAI